MKLQKIKRMMKSWVAIIATSAAASASVHAAEPVPLTMCAFMLMGEGGPEHQFLQDYQTAALSWGVKLTLKPYMNEKVVVEELKAGVCDITNLTSMQARSFNKFTGTLDAPAAIPTYDHFRTVLQTLAKPSAEKYMQEGEFEIIGIQSAGAIFLFSNDRKLTGLSDLAGKRMAILDSAPEVRKLVVDLGMTPVSSTVTNIFQKFNNGAVDITGGPAIVYEMMELHKGLEPNGGILAQPIMQASMQFVGRTAKLPRGFGQKSRQYFVDNFDRSLNILRTAEENVPKKWWIPLPEERRDEFNAQTLRVRLAFRDQNVYDARMLTLLRKIRCNKEPTLAECSATNAE
jgi:hypothetical protein